MDNRGVLNKTCPRAV